MPYCDITNDLQRAFSRIEDYQYKEIIEAWESEGSNIYSKNGTGYVGNVYVDGTMYTEGSNITPSAGEWYYSEDTDKLYIHITGDADPANYQIEAGEDWDAYKTVMRNKAMQMVDAYLNSKYVTPLAPRMRKLHDTAEYEYPIVYATALCTCWLIGSRVAPHDQTIRALYKQFYNPNPEIGETKGIINQLVDGDMVLQDQISVREAGGWNIYPYSSNSVTVYPIFSGEYTGNKEMIWRIQIDTAGEIGTATYKVSYDGGSNWDLTGQKTKDDDNNKIRFFIASGVWVRFPAETYSEGDYWDLELFPLSDTATNAKIGSIRGYR